MSLEEDLPRESLITPLELALTKHVIPELVKTSLAERTGRVHLPERTQGVVLDPKAGTGRIHKMGKLVDGATKNERAKSVESAKNKLSNSHLKDHETVHIEAGLEKASERLREQRDLLQQKIAQMCIDLEVHEVYERVQIWFSRGMDIEEFYLEMIGPAIGLFHTWWDEDRITFVDVTRGSWTMQHLLYLLSPSFVQGGEKSRIAMQLRCLMTLVPGSHHSIGLLIASEYFRRRGWQVSSSVDWSRAEILNALSSQWFDAFFLSVSTQVAASQAQALISAARKLSLNPGIKVFIAGSQLSRDAGLALRVGADQPLVSLRHAHGVVLKELKGRAKARELQGLGEIPSNTKVRRGLSSNKARMIGAESEQQRA
jgi:methanogenic corrinoid protein MtbC1